LPPPPPTSPLFPYTTLFRSLRMSAPKRSASRVIAAVFACGAVGLSACRKSSGSAGGPSASASEPFGLAPDLASRPLAKVGDRTRSEEHTSELQSLRHLVCRL